MASKEGKTRKNENIGSNLLLHIAHNYNTGQSETVLINSDNSWNFFLEFS